MNPLVLALILTQVQSPAFDDVVSRIETQRQELASRYRRAPARTRPAVVAEARAFVVSVIIDELFPAWMGTPWGLGAQSDASRPHQPGKVVGCSYFITAILQNAGLELESRSRFAQAPSLWIERALMPYGGQLHRFGSLPAPELRKRIAALGDGLYVVGLDYHVGFLVVRGPDVRIVHASYFPPQAVVSEPVEASAAIEGSRPKGYWVSPLFQDDRLVDLWLRGAAVPAPPPWPPIRAATTGGGDGGARARSPLRPR
jgi:hypothetical protein